MTWVAVAIGGSALLGYMGSQNAASAQRDAANAASGTVAGQNAQTRADQLPYMNRGNAAGNQLAYLMGLNVPQSQSMNTFDGAAYLRDNPDVAAAGRDPWAHYQEYGQREGRRVTYTPDNPGGSLGSALGGSPGAGFGSLATPFSATNWQADPGYAFRLSEGQKALERSGSAKGMTLSGAQQKALVGYGQGMGSQEYQAAYGRYNNDQTNMFNRLSGIAGTGQQANQFVGQMGANTANQVGQNQLGAGNASAAGWVGGTNAISNGINQGVNYWQNQNMWNSMMDQQNAGSAGAAYGNWMAQNAGRVPYAGG